MLFDTARRSPMAWLNLALLAAPVCRLPAQAVVAAPTQWRVWAFGSVGAAETWQVGTNRRPSLSGGLAASYGTILGIVRATDIDRGSFEDTGSNTIHDYSVLAGARSRGDRLFIAAAAGFAQATLDRGGTSSEQLAPAFDLSAHADYRVAGVALAISGVLGPASTRYVAISLGADLGWLGF